MATYNGWTNHETWRVNLEGGFTHLDLSDLLAVTTAQTLHQATKEVAVAIKDIAYDMIDDECPEPRSGYSFTRCMAWAFLQDVNWYEIAEHLIDDNADELPEHLAAEYHAARQVA